jgi:hypothetical protein
MQTCMKGKASRVSQIRLVNQALISKLLSICGSFARARFLQYWCLTVVVDWCGETR